MLLPKGFFIYPKNKYANHRLSFSQEGEDMVLSRIFESRKNGFYVDVGAHHPTRFSNTYFFYLQGWRGINIDAMPGSMKIFKKIRPRDINLEIGISSSQKEMEYFIFNEPALNSFSKNTAYSLHQDQNNHYTIVNRRTIETFTLEETLDRYLPVSQSIDFLTIDVEGLDLEVLHSNNWKKYRPDFVLVEDLNKRSIDDFFSSDLYKYMTGIQYQLFSKCLHTLLFKRVS